MYSSVFINNRVKGDDRKKWNPVIACQLSVANRKIIYICDLHFHPADLAKNSAIVSANLISNPDNSMKTIPIEEYRRLVQASVELCKANETIDKLNILLQKNDKIIENLKAKLVTHTEAAHLSHVSER